MSEGYTIDADDDGTAGIVVRCEGERDFRLGEAGLIGIPAAGPVHEACFT
jgi:hypothetical protein